MHNDRYKSSTGLVALVLLAALLMLGGAATGSAKPQPARTTRYLRHQLGRDRQPGLHRGCSDARRGAHDLRLRRDRRLRLGDGDRGRLRAVRGRRRRARRGLARGGRRGRGAPRSSSTTCRPRRRRSSIRRTPRRWPRFRTARRRRTASPSARASPQLLIAQRAGDGFRAPVTYTPPNPPIPGVWIPTAATPPIGTVPRAHAAVQPRLGRPVPPDGPPALASKKWARDYNEVKEIGSSTSTTRTPNRPWPPGSGPSRRCSRHAARSASSSSTISSTSCEAARFMAMVSVTYADALIACFDAKYHYAFWRPITAIRAGRHRRQRRDRRRSDVVDRCSPARRTTPSTRAHTPASRRPAGLVIARFLGTPEIDFTIPSLTGLGDRHFATRQGSRVRGRQRPHLGRHPLPLRGRGRRRDRQEDRPPGARAPLPAVERLDGFEGRPASAGLPSRLAGPVSRRPGNRASGGPRCRASPLAGRAWRRARRRAASRGSSGARRRRARVSRRRCRPS